MYSTCLFCNSALGSNGAIEQFPVGRRLAFDPARGRLWVVCRQCERWNLTPLEERWEAIESCARAFRESRLRVSTDHIGLARLREGLELVRIGEPQRPEMAAWRYGDQFGRRRRRSLLVGGGIAAATVGYTIAGPVLGLVTTFGIGGIGMWNLFSFGDDVYRSRAVAARIPGLDGKMLVIQQDQLRLSALLWDPAARRWSLGVSHRTPAAAASPWWRFQTQRASTTLTGDGALRAARLVLPSVNTAGAGQALVREATDYLGMASTSEALFARAARTYTTSRRFEDAGWGIRLSAIPVSVRLALEMSANEETERRALEGELHLLESAWRDAEEIAGIADDMFLPASVDADLRRLKGEAP